MRVMTYPQQEVGRLRLALRMLPDIHNTYNIYGRANGTQPGLLDKIGVVPILMIR